MTKTSRFSHGSDCEKCRQPYIAPVCARRGGGKCRIKHYCGLCRFHMNDPRYAPDDCGNPEVGLSGNLTR